MKSFLLFFIIFYSLNADFISKYEYGEMLFKNPRGISCINCHDTILDIKTINKKELKVLLKNGKSKSIMPIYRFTEEEIDALHSYLNTK